MKGIFHWLSMNLPGGSATDTDSPQEGSRNDEGDDEPVNIADLHLNIDDLMPDIYGEATGDTVPMLEIVKVQSQESDGSAGVDPYDTAKLEVAKK